MSELREGGREREGEGEGEGEGGRERGRSTSSLIKVWYAVLIMIPF